MFSDTEARVLEFYDSEDGTSTPGRIRIWKDDALVMDGASPYEVSVPYESSHLEGAVSEMIVKDTHTCTDNPRVIREVRRILLLHANRVARSN